MNVSEHYEYKKNADAQKQAMKEEQEKEKKSKNEQDKERIKDAVTKTATFVTNIPHYAKLTGAAALLGLLGSGVGRFKEEFK